MPLALQSPLSSGLPLGGRPGNACGSQRPLAFGEAPGFWDLPRCHWSQEQAEPRAAASEQLVRGRPLLGAHAHGAPSFSEEALGRDVERTLFLFCLSLGLLLPEPFPSLLSLCCVGGSVNLGLHKLPTECPAPSRSRNCERPLAPECHCTSAGAPKIEPGLLLPVSHPTSPESSHLQESLCQH